MLLRDVCAVFMSVSMLLASKTCGSIIIITRWNSSDTFSSFRHFSPPMHQRISDEEAVVHFKEVLQFETVSALGPDNGSYDACASWLLKLCAACGLKASILPESKPNKPIVIAEW